jgi:signal transduction histidine kinase
VGIFSPNRAEATFQDAGTSSPPPEDVRILSEGHTYSGTTDQIYHFQVRSDSTVVLGVGPNDSSVVIPVSLFELVNERISVRLFKSQMTQSRLNVGVEDRALHLSLIQRYDLLFLGGAGTGLVLLVGISTWLGIRLRRSRLAQKTLRTRYQLLQEGEERERRRLAREIHDGPVQALHGLHMQVVGTSMAQQAESTTRGDGKPSPADSSSSLSADLMSVARELRAISEGLHPASLERFGLVAALRSHARRLLDLSDLSQQDEAPSIHVEGPEELFDLSDTKRLALYRMGQEAITNAIHHANATSIDVRAWNGDETVFLTISDDGCGFDTDRSVASQPHAASDSNGLGLIGLKERATMIGAAVTVDSTRGAGTMVSIRINNQNTKTG